MDARPPNAYERGLNRGTRLLGNISALYGLTLGEGEDLAGYSRDLKDYYHQFKVNRERAARNASCVYASSTLTDVLFYTPSDFM